MSKDELKGYIKAFKKYAKYALSEKEYDKELKNLLKPKQRR
jgi:hypothetical protein|tara:strand:- start:3337 stop:3459 length:123 start_codon:yes stop_codon:yes gene_type:complete